MGLEVGDKFNTIILDILLIATPLLVDKVVAKLPSDTELSSTPIKKSGVWSLVTVTVYDTITPDNNIRLFAVTVTLVTALTGTSNKVDTLCCSASINEALDAWLRVTPGMICEGVEQMFRNNTDIR